MSHYQTLHSVSPLSFPFSGPPEVSWVQYSVLPVPIAISPDSVLYVNFSERVGSVLMLLGQNITAKLAKERRDA